MIKKVLAVVIVCALLSISITGCTVSNTTSSPSPTETPNFSPFYEINGTSVNETSSAITDNYTEAGYVVIKRFTEGVNQYGNPIFEGVVEDTSSSQLGPYEHDITIELMKDENQTTERVNQLKEYYIKQGYSIPGDLTSGLNNISMTNDSNATHQLTIGLCDPNVSCISNYTFDRFIVVVDNGTKIV